MDVFLPIAEVSVNILAIFSLSGLVGILVWSYLVLVVVS